MSLHRRQVLAYRDYVTIWVVGKVGQREVALKEFEHSWYRSHFEAECAQNVLLLVQDGAMGKAIVPDARQERIHKEWCDVLVFACHEHARNADYV